MEQPQIIDAARNGMGEPTAIGEDLDRALEKLLKVETDLLVAHAETIRSVPVGAPERDVLESHFDDIKRVVSMQRVLRTMAINATRSRRS